METFSKSFARFTPLLVISSWCATGSAEIVMLQGEKNYKIADLFLPMSNRDALTEEQIDRVLRRTEFAYKEDDLEFFQELWKDFHNVCRDEAYAKVMLIALRAHLNDAVKRHSAGGLKFTEADAPQFGQNGGYMPKKITASVTYRNFSEPFNAYDAVRDVIQVFASNDLPERSIQVHKWKSETDSFIGDAKTASLDSASEGARKILRRISTNVKAGISWLDFGSATKIAASSKSVHLTFGIRMAEVLIESLPASKLQEDFAVWCRENEMPISVPQQADKTF